VTIITPEAGCSSTSTATVSTTGATGCFTFRAAFFTGAGLGLALATVRFVAFATLDALRALPRLAEFPLRSFARFCTFDAFLRLAMTEPPLVVALAGYAQGIADQRTNGKSRQLIQRVFKSLLECNVVGWSPAQDNEKKGEQKPALFCFTNCCHGGFGYSRSYHRPQLLDRMEKRRMACGPYCKFRDRSEERDPLSSAAETADDAASSQARGC
jgi:hypothetical protein